MTAKGRHHKAHAQDVIPVEAKQVPEHTAIYADPATERLLSLAESVAKTPSTVLLTGESGAGKEVIARYIHHHSPRASKPFVAINCAALPPTLLESELFGHEKGAFSGAVQRHLGLFEQANKGSILLDEISEIAPEMQAKLLRVLQERVMYRVGGKEPIKLDIRVIATSNRDLRKCVDEGTFRLDLYYRLNVFPLRVLALRERPADIEPLAKFYAAKFSKQLGGNVRGISKRAIEELQSYAFPGNVRELTNIVERAVILAGGKEVIDIDHLILETNISVFRPEPTSLEEITSQVEQDDFRVSFTPGSEPLTDVRRKIILGTLARFNGNRTRTAEALGVSLRTIRNKIRDYKEKGISVPDSES